MDGETEIKGKNPTKFSSFSFHATTAIRHTTLLFRFISAFSLSSASWYALSVATIFFFTSATNVALLALLLLFSCLNEFIWLGSFAFHFRIFHLSLFTIIQFSMMCTRHNLRHKRTLSGPIHFISLFSLYRSCAALSLPLSLLLVFCCSIVP